MKRFHTVIICALLFLISSCASINQAPAGQATEFLVPTADFTMHLPPFLTIEVLKNSRIPVIGTTSRGGKDYRVVLLPAAAAALRFLINDDGSFEGSAINNTGSRMGFTYTPSPANVRLVAEAAVPQSPLLSLTSQQKEAIHAAVDAHLAATLKDPASAIQYGVGDPTECRNVAILDPNSRDSWCVCYLVNAKNSMGGYTGAQIGVTQFISQAPPYLMLDIPQPLINHPNACGTI
ncbi:MAG: hypothetical protein ABI304_02315, partial [Rudaea sp.]